MAEDGSDEVSDCPSVILLIGVYAVPADQPLLHDWKDRCEHLLHACSRFHVETHPQ